MNNQLKSMIVRPRLNDYHGILLLQDKVDYAIPFINEDIPLFVDPFLLWKSPSQMDNGIHNTILDSFNYIGHLAQKGEKEEAIRQLIMASECDAVGLGSFKTRKGRRIGESTANEIVSLFEIIPQLKSSGFTHLEEILLLVDKIAKDRISDIACNFMSSFLIDYTHQNCIDAGIPMEMVKNISVYDVKSHSFKEEDVELPVNPNTHEPIWLVPKRWLRFSPWISQDEYFSNYYPEKVDRGDFFKDRIKVLMYNRANFDLVKGYIEERERTFKDCKNDPLFMQIPITSAKRKIGGIKALPTGKIDNADKKYEEAVVQLMASLLYPHLDFAQAQSRTESGTQIRDLIFYNNQSLPFFKDIFDTYGSRQIVFELKNVDSLDRNNVNQLNRYLNENLGKFGIFVTRHQPSKAIQKHLIDIWSGQRKCILVLDDNDLQMMVDIFENKQRLPYEVIRKKYSEFIKRCPS